MESLVYYEMGPNILFKMANIHGIPVFTAILENYSNFYRVVWSLRLVHMGFFVDPIPAPLQTNLTLFKFDKFCLV